LFNSTVDNGNLARYTLKEDIRLWVSDIAFTSNDTERTTRR
jgi:hypothetical protein